MDIRIHTIDFGTPEFDEALRLRYDVLRAPLGLTYTPEQLAEEYNQIHLAGFDSQGMMIAYLNLTPGTDGLVKMRQVAVDTSWQGKGVGRILVAESEILASSLGFSHMTLHARETAVPFYERLGYRRVGERFEEVTIPHFKMEKSLSPS